MRKIQRVHDGDLLINEPSDISATVRGSLYVERGRVTVSGHVAGDVVVESGKTVVTGSVGGSVRNIGGVVVVIGTVEGSVVGEDDYTTIESGAIVRNGAIPGLAAPATAPPAPVPTATAPPLPEAPAPPLPVAPAASPPAAPAAVAIDPTPEPASSTIAKRPVRAEVTTVEASPLKVSTRPKVPTWLPGLAVLAVASAIVAVVGLFFLDRSKPSTASTTRESTTMAPVSIPEELLPPIPTTNPSETTVPTTSPPLVTADPEAQRIRDSAVDMLDSLTVAKFMLAPVAYNQDDYVGWFDGNNDCQSTRTEVLIAEAVGEITYDDTGCKVERGRWIDPWTGDLITEPNNAVVEPIIPLSHAHAAGVWDWPAAQKLRFANDLDPAALNIVTGVLTADRRGQSPADWRPPPAAWCNYALAWVRTKWRWNLPVLQPEADALREMLDSCLDGSPIAIPTEFIEPVAERQR